jgi:hypothetical protein
MFTMIKMRCSVHVLILGIFLTLGPLVFAQTQKAIWPFDQRQISLIQKQGTGFPDSATVALVMDTFVKKGRVRWVTQKAGTNQIVPMEVPSDFSWQSPLSVKNLGLKFKSDGLLVLSQSGLQIDLHWYATTDGQPLFYETISLPNATGSAEQIAQRKERINQWLSDIWSRIPGQGYVVRRDLKNLSVEGLAQVGGKVGDQVELKRLEKIERHPLLKTVIGMSSSLSGRGRVTAIDGLLSTVQVEYESQLDPIQEGDRYVILTSAPPANAPDSGEKSVPIVSSVNADGPKIVDQEDGRKYVPLFAGSASNTPPANVEGAEEEPKYKILDLSGWLTYGRVTHSENVVGQADSKEMKALSPGFRMNLKGYVTREILLLTDIDFSYLKFKGLTDTYATDSITSGLTAFRVAGAYRYIFLEVGPLTGELNLHFGFRRLGLAMATVSSAIAPTAKNYSGYDFGATVILPVMQKYSGYFKFSKMLWAKLAESPLEGGASSSNSVWQFEAGAKWRMNPTTELSAGLLFDSASSTYTGDGTRTTSSVSTSLSSTLYQFGGTFKF